MRLTSSAAAGFAHLGSEPRTPVCGTICRTCSIGTELTPSPWAETTPWSAGPALWGAEARPQLGSALGPHQQPQEPACSLPVEVPSPTSPARLWEAPSGRLAVCRGLRVCYSWQSWDSAGLVRLELLLGVSWSRVQTLPLASQIT